MSVLDDILKEADDGARRDNPATRRASTQERQSVPGATASRPTANAPKAPPVGAPEAPRNTLEEAFGKLLGRRPTDKEKQDLYRARDALGLKNTDAMWLLLMALGHYETVYRTFPGLIAKAASDVVEGTKATAEAQLRAAAAAAEANLARAVAKTASEIAARTASTQRWRWAGACLVGAGVMFMLLGVLSYRVGERVGLTRGYAQAINDQTAVVTAPTPQSRPARRTR